ncbi:hypothetical protein HNP25_004430 [Arcicella rosea]|uniref:Uncharacterized protein n=1 Tax=Arcicella rosea TaxID=502909 RepID=A0A841ES29_9BACT|nr:hypothetical protein [Arcicella rosea]
MKNQQGNSKDIVKEKPFYQPNKMRQLILLTVGRYLYQYV